MLRKYISNPSHVLWPQMVELNENFTYEEYPVTIVNRQVRQFCTTVIPMLKVLWSNIVLVRRKLICKIDTPIYFNIDLKFEHEFF